MPRKIILIHTFTFLLILPTLSYGQEEKNFFTKMKNLRQTFSDSDFVQKALDQVEKEESKVNPISILQSVRNPFDPRIPKEEVGKTEITQNPLSPSGQPSVQPAQQPQVETPLPSFQVYGLIWNTRRPQAILDSQIVEIGDTIKGCTVMNINKEGVLLSFQDRTFTVKP